MKPRLVVALDVPDPERAVSLVDQLAPEGVLFKVGYEAFYGYASIIGRALARHESQYALDLKLHDIPRTVDAAIRSVVTPGVRIVTVHALGGIEMLRAAVEASRERAAELGMPVPEIYAVTVLTSLETRDLAALGLAESPVDNAIRLAALAREAKCAGVVCSVREVRPLRDALGDGLRTFCPGVRPGGAAHGDQKRTMTPRDAREAGADYVVVGRPIVEDADPVGATRAILAELAA